MPSFLDKPYFNTPSCSWWISIAGICINNHLLARSPRTFHQKTCIHCFTMVYSLVIEHGSLEDPRTKWRFYSQEHHRTFYGPFSSKPCLMTGEYTVCDSYHLLSTWDLHIITMVYFPKFHHSWWFINLFLTNSSPDSPACTADHDMHLAGTDHWYGYHGGHAWGTRMGYSGIVEFTTQLIKHEQKSEWN